MHALARLALTPFLLLAQPAWAQEEPAPSRTLDDEAPVRALLVGVNEYPSLRAHYESIDRLAVYNSRIRLQGPVNDAGRTAEVLRTVLEFPGESIQTMTSGSAVPPTRTNILAGLDRLVEDARSGELVVIFLAGHGDQVPDISGDESDGKDEVFLPEDTSRWNSKEGRIPGSIRDDVLNEKFAAIAATGARVWLIVDACHSGTLFRGGVGDVRYRTLDSELLGIPSDATAASVAPGSVPRRDEASVDADFPGDVIAMYAAEPTQRAQEQGYASGDASVRHGSFTWHLTQQLSRLGGQRSFQELISRVQGAFRSQAIYNQTPVGHGDLSAAIDGSVGDDLSSMQLGVSGQDMVVNAGSIRGLSNGDVLDVFAPFHRGEREHLIGQVRIDEVRPSSAFVVPTDEGGVEFDQVRTADASRLPVEISSASLDVKRIRIAFRNRSGQEIAASDLPEEFRAAFDTERMQRLTAFSSISEADAILELEDPTDPDTAGRFLWSRADLAPVKFESGKAHQVAGRSYRARNLRQLASHSVVGNLPADVVVRLEEEIDGKWVPLPEFARLVPGSRFRVFAKNASETPVQVWVFLFLPDLQIFRALPTGPQLREGAVLRPGAEWERKLRADDAPLGPGALVAMVLSEDAVGIDGLAAEPYDGTRTRGAGMNELLGDLAFGHAEGVRTRGIGVDDEGSLEGVGLLNYDVQYDFGATERPFSLLPAEGESFLGSPDLLVRPTISDSAFARTLTEARLEARERGLSEVYERLAPAVFVVRTRSSHGTGFLIDNEQGLLLTNHHVVSTGWQYSKNGRWLVDLTRGQIDPQTGFMSAEDQELKAEVVHLDERRDLAMLRIVGDHPWLEGHPVLEVGASGAADPLVASARDPAQPQGRGLCGRSASSRARRQGARGGQDAVVASASADAGHRRAADRFRGAGPQSLGPAGRIGRAGADRDGSGMGLGPGLGGAQGRRSRPDGRSRRVRSRCSVLAARKRGSAGPGRGRRRARDARGDRTRALGPAQRRVL
ncbi:MAG: caspase family protein [Planctomycetota bacterium]